VSTKSDNSKRREHGNAALQSLSGKNVRLARSSDHLPSTTTPLFFEQSAGLTIGEIANLSGAKPKPGTRAADLITSAAPLEYARSSDLTFLASPRYASALGSTGAGACLTTERFASQAPSGLNVLCTDQPYRAFVKIMRLLFRDALRPSSPFESAAIDSTAIIHPSAEVGSEVTVDPGSVIGPRAFIGDATALGAMTVIDANVHIGRGCSIGSNTNDYSRYYR
jgi:UDP-3-O-[3-hydroxymyristoyl] glucosamine N-acyltransferase